MKAACLVLLLCGARLFATTPPDSIAGKVYRETSLIVSTRSSGEKTIVFGADGRFVYLKSGAGGALVLRAPFKIFLQQPRPDGTYTYRRSGESTAVVNLDFDDGTKETLALTFSTPNGGGIGPVPGQFDFSFVFSDSAALQAAPAANIALRGHVAAGRPLIAGFVVPGTPRTTSGFVPPPDAAQREVLIRVVGPSLSAFGVTGAWADPDFQLFQGNAAASVNEDHYADWGVPSVAPDLMNPGTEAAFNKVFRHVGAFPLTSSSKDAVELVRLSPGTYTIVASAAAGDAGGAALIEVYFLP